MEGQRNCERLIKTNIVINNYLNNYITEININGRLLEYRNDNRPVDLYCRDCYTELMGEIAIDKDLELFFDEIKHMFKIIKNYGIIVIIFGNKNKYAKIKGYSEIMLAKSNKNLKVYFLGIQEQAIKKFRDMNKENFYLALDKVNSVKLNEYIYTLEPITNNLRYYKNLEFVTNFQHMKKDIYIGYLHKQNNRLNDKFLRYGAGIEKAELQVCTYPQIIQYSFAQDVEYIYIKIKELNLKYNNLNIEYEDIKKRNTAKIIFKPKNQNNLDMFICTVAKLYKNLLAYVCTYKSKL